MIGPGADASLEHRALSLSAAAVREEHCNPDAAALRDEADLRQLLVQMMGRTGRTP